MVRIGFVIATLLFSQYKRWVTISQPISEGEARTRLEQDGGRGLADLFAAYRERLRGALALRLDQRAQSRIDPSDVIQETFVEAEQRLEDYLQKSEVAPYVWIRFLALQRLAILQRFHLHTQQRDARREVSIDQADFPQASSETLAARILDGELTPARAVQQAEQQAHLQAALEQMDPLDREVLVLRHFEQMSNQETAEALRLSPGAASKRYYAALKRLQEILAQCFGENSGLSP
jgi:RNA polymerase sigma-70 factor (ECF subfamily)